MGMLHDTATFVLFAHAWKGSQKDLVTRAVLHADNIKHQKAL